MSAALSYSRVSTENQRFAGVSLDVQKSEIEQYASANGLKVAVTVSEPKSGRSSDMLMNFCDNKGIKHVIVADISRFSRNVELGKSLLWELVKYGKRVHFVREQLVVSPDDVVYESLAYHKFMQILHEAENESVRLSERISLVKKYKKEQGEYIGGGIPYGLELYEVTQVNSEGLRKQIKKYKFNEYEANVIRLINLAADKIYLYHKYNELLAKISTTKDRGALVMFLNKSGTILSLLENYEIKYRGKEFTRSIIKNMTTIDKLQAKYGVSDYHVENMVDMFSNLGTNVSKANVDKMDTNEETCLPRETSLLVETNLPKETETPKSPRRSKRIRNIGTSLKIKEKKDVLDLVISEITKSRQKRYNLRKRK